jgi:hypothetical protein
MNTRDEFVKQSTLANMLVESNIGAAAARSAMVSAACIVLLLLTTSCGFPRPPDVGADASEDTGGGTAGPAITATGSASLKNLRVLTSAVAVQAETAANLTVDNLDITGTAGACSTGIALNGNSTLTASAFATRLLGVSLQAKDHSTAMLMRFNVNATGDPSCTSSILNVSSTGMFMFSDVLIDGGGNGAGIRLGSPSGSGPTQATLNNAIVRNVNDDALNVGNATVQMTGGELSHIHGTGFDVVGGKLSLTNVSIVMNSGAAFYSQDTMLTMRGCTVANNSQGGDLGVRAVADLGTVMDPGNNVFNNSGVGLLIEGGNGTQLIQAVGNTWKPVQGAGSNGKYVLGTSVPGPINCDSPSSGNFCIQVSDESIEL